MTLSNPLAHISPPPERCVVTFLCKIRKALISSGPRYCSVGGRRARIHIDCQTTSRLPRLLHSGKTSPCSSKFEFPTNEAQDMKQLLIVIALLAVTTTESYAGSSEECDGVTNGRAEDYRDMAVSVRRMFSRSGAFNGLQQACFGGSSSSSWIDYRGDLEYWAKYMNDREIETFLSAYNRGFDQYKEISCRGSWHRTYTRRMIFNWKSYRNFRQISLRHAKTISGCRSG